MEEGLNRTAADAGERELNLETTLACAEVNGLDGEKLQACAEGTVVGCMAEGCMAGVGWAVLGWAAGLCFLARIRRHSPCQPRAPGCSAHDVRLCCAAAARAAGPQGEELEAKAATETWNLSPKKVFVPWVGPLRCRLLPAAAAAIVSSLPSAARRLLLPAAACCCQPLLLLLPPCSRPAPLQP